MSKLKINPKELLVRPVDPKKDLNLILSTWLKSYRNSEFAVAVPNNIYFPFHQGLITQILLHENNNVTILCSPEDPDQIIGYIVYNVKEPIIYYVYIKYPFRRLGLGCYIFEGIKKHYDDNLNLGKYAIHCTHKPRNWRKIARPNNLIYNPYVVSDFAKDQIINEGKKDEKTDES